MQADDPTKSLTPKSNGRVILSSLAIAIFSIALVLSYIAAYTMGNRSTSPTDDHIVFPYKWQARLFGPAGKIDAASQTGPCRLDDSQRIGCPARNFPISALIGQLLCLGRLQRGIQRLTTSIVAVHF